MGINQILGIGCALFVGLAFQEASGEDRYTTKGTLALAELQAKNEALEQKISVLEENFIALKKWVEKSPQEVDKSQVRFTQDDDGNCGADAQAELLARLCQIMTISSKGDVLFTPNNLQVESQNDIELNAEKKMIATAHALELQSNTDIELDASASLGLRAVTGLTIESLTSVDITGAALLKLTGGLTKINGTQVILNNGGRPVTVQNASIAGNKVLDGSPTVLVP